VGPCHLQIKKIIDDAINIPDEDNDWMREQLRELAVINGTLRDSDTIKSASFIPVLVHRFLVLLSNSHLALDVWWWPLFAAVHRVAALPGKPG